MCHRLILTLSDSVCPQEKSRLTDYVKDEVAANMVDRLLVGFTVEEFTLQEVIRVK